jgi:3-phenylpropionate/trans-cinnamate dioxygenase ferredoxin subunit
MNSTHEPEAPGKTGATSNSALHWTYVLDDPALPEGGIAPAYPLGVNVLLARVGGTVYAVSGKCAHMACPLFMGRLEGYTIVCGCHDWRFDVRTGRFLAAPELGLAVYPTKIEAGKLFVNLGSKESS